jgi:DNA-3-methyladenine glycosylase I
MPKTDQQEPAHRPRGGESRNRCSWTAGDALLEAYHDREWGVPLHDDQLLFELLTLEGAQAGLSWLTVLRRRDYAFMEAAGLVNDHLVTCFRYSELT